MSKTVPNPQLTDAQADGLACVHCGRDYLIHRAVAHVPLDRDGEFVRGPSGSQLFVCANTCEYDVKGTRAASTPGVHTVDTLARDHVADAGKMLGGDHVRDVPEKVVSDADIPAAPTIDELARVADWLDISTADLIHWREVGPGLLPDNFAGRFDTLYDWVDQLGIDMAAVMRHLGVTRPGGAR